MLMEVLYTSRVAAMIDFWSFWISLGNSAGLVEPRQDRAEDVLERLGVKLHDGKQVVVPLIPLRDGRAPAAGRAHRRHKQAVLHRPEVILARVPPLVVHELPQQLDWGC